MFPVKLLKKVECAESTYEFIFSKPDDYMYRSGQHAGLILKDPIREDSELRHTFSFTSSPVDDEISFLTRIRDSEYKKHISSLNEGNEATLALPGGFEIAEGLTKDENFVYLCAGVGITPFLSFLRNIELRRSKGNAVLMWSNRNPNTTPHFDKFVNGEFAKNDNLDLHLFMTEAEPNENYTNGRIDQVAIKNVVEQHSPAQFYVIGMPSFVDAMTSQLISIGIPFEKIITENFSGY